MSDAVQSDSTSKPLKTDSPDDFNSFHFWRIQPDVVDDRSLVSACGDSLASLVISSSTDNWSQVHTVGDSVRHGLSDSNHNVKASMYFKLFLSFLFTLPSAIG